MPTPGKAVCKLAWRRTQPYAVVRTAVVNTVFGGAPCGGTKRVRGVPKWAGRACGPCHWGLWWSSLWGHGTCEGCAEIGGGEACGRSHWGLRWKSLGNPNRSMWHLEHLHLAPGMPPVVSVLGCSGSSTWASQLLLTGFSLLVAFSQPPPPA